MTRKVARQRARIDQLVDELSIGAACRLHRDSDEIHEVVGAVVAYLIEEYPAQDLYIPAGIRPDAYPRDAIRAAVLGGESARSVCRRFRLHRRKLYEILGDTD